MAQIRTLERRCDRCDSVEGTESRMLRLPATGRQVTFDACENCRATVSLSEWEALIPKSPRAPRGGVVVSEAVVKQAARGRRKV